jgi:DNA replication protein DnaC
MGDLTKLQDLMQKLEQGGKLPSLAEASKNLAEKTEISPALCPKCKGNGFYVPAIQDYTDPRFGKPVACDCDAVERNKRRRSAIMIEKLRYKAGADTRGLYRYHPDDLHQDDASKRRPLTLDVLKEARKWSKSQQAAMELASIFVATAPSCSIEYKGVTKKAIGLFGDKGFGKTLIASAVVNSLEAAGQPVFGIRLVDLIKRVNSVYEQTRAANSAYDERPEFTSAEILDAFVNFPILVIDEFEINNVTASRLDVVESLVNGRYAVSLPTFITTNMDVTGISKLWGERVSDRIRDAYWFLKLDGVKLRDTSNEIIIG